MNRLENKVIIITGAAQGMGKIHAEKMLAQGAKVVITDINEEKGREVQQELGDNSLFIKHDVSSESDWKNVVDMTLEKFGQIDALVNNAGITYNYALEDLTLDDYMKIVNINQVSVFLGTKAVTPSMKAQNSGSIINISSMNGLIGGAAGYTDTKFAVRGFTKACARELSPHNIRVNSVHPGVVHTPMLEQEGVKEAVEQFKKTIPLRRVAQPEEVSDMVIFLASDESQYSTGSEFVIDGGVSAL
ncbi:glucose 1-dehydrogenase [Phocicoccus pinnipedialis]|uniref:3-alpha-(Or 20-beta)-hydroxysteroid dehydrogenase n=1 Tax=Phocicoccus pinnipedialis TaxID=110845 RepID=A0A6V7R4X3_9BACL|nr:glucose 1-dehydrogenase [Jeotgalicoccus pinnipedialis]MBP1939754.1 3alpha(or 20beta)-hydroxysteroid dehydrogenase [Jeotgalicoccus pinnipedialis]CAD2072376.1 3-alpha-(or 20-beta)-hydroxysteroid dehydrogenase [Jeotgalicoccus pinnipedialis]